LLYETTELFFEYFGIKNVDDLPNSAELRAAKLPEPELEKPSEKDEKNAEAKEKAPPQNEFEDLGK